jgi:hypothetical protein
LPRHRLARIELAGRTLLAGVPPDGGLVLIALLRPAPVQ